ncbi:hypothetical protein EDC96DRAFT_580888 [Choanephora cucurbitarum]|nr:hypothetical protein EDC96DRAFT_580888 [Choanephora cucurbitarum]
MTDILPNNPPYPAYRATNKESFAYDTTVRRWPIIIDSAITDVKTTSAESKQERVEESENIISALEEIKQEIAKDTPLRLIKDKRHDAEKWNEDLTKYFPEATWFSGTWLFNECYLYRRSYNAVFDLARKMPELIKPMPEEKQEIIYDELIQICLWGNATDLSLLTNMSQEDIHRLQAVEQDRLAERRKFILADDTEKLWQKIKTLDNDRVDFVLDNSGFEVYVDMIFADWLLQTKKAGKVVFNCKTIPWFVSDVMPKDMPLMFDHCLDRDFFPHREDRSEEDFQALEVMVKRWKDYVATGQLEIRSDDFWCTGHAYWYMESVAPELFQDLATQSKLVIFKGDLNFRKLVFDCDWPVTTPFREAIGPSMAEKFTNIVSLRTNKADPIVGLTEETKKEIESKASRDEWRFSGKYAVVVYN